MLNLCSNSRIPLRDLLPQKPLNLAEYLPFSVACTGSVFGNCTIKLTVFTESRYNKLYGACEETD